MGEKKKNNPRKRSHIVYETNFKWNEMVSYYNDLVCMKIKFYIEILNWQTFLFLMMYLKLEIWDWLNNTNKKMN